MVPWQFRMLLISAYEPCSWDILFPTTWIKKLQLQKLRVYATATNLLTFTDFLSYSPELTPGAYPESKQYVFGINVSF